MARLLIRHGADVNVVRTAFTCYVCCLICVWQGSSSKVLGKAARGDHHEIVQLLLDHGADVTARSSVTSFARFKLCLN